VVVGGPCDALRAGIGMTNNHPDAEFRLKAGGSLSQKASIHFDVFWFGKNVENCGARSDLLEM